MAEGRLPEHRTRRRSLLVTPGDNDALLEKLRLSESDVAVIELEDGVHETRKQVARDTCAAALMRRDWSGKETVVRINAPESQEAGRDIQWIVPSRPTAILIPKAETPEVVRLTASRIDVAENQAGLAAGSVRIWLQVETALGVVELERMIEADSRIEAVVLGCGDLSADLGVKRIGIGAFRRTSVEAHELLVSRSHVVALARAAGIDCFDSGSTHLRNLDLLAERTVSSACLGFTGVMVISPRHVAVVNRVLSAASDLEDQPRSIGRRQPASGG